MKPRFKRVLLKLSGEALMGNLKFGIDPKIVGEIANQIANVKNDKIQVAIVVGGGNIWRGMPLSIKANGGIDRVTGDYMGMLATIINSLALQGSLELANIDTRVMTSIEVQKVAEPYIRRRAIRHLEKGRLVIFAGGTGSPYFTTDTTAALRAVEIGADVILKATNVDGVYDRDPKKFPNAHKFLSLSYMEAIKRRLKIMDTTALSLCMDNQLPIIVFNLFKAGNIKGSIYGKRVGTIIK